MGVSRKAYGHCLQTFLFGVELEQNRLKKFLEKGKKMLFFLNSHRV
jgi:hypothetical protein